MHASSSREQNLVRGKELMRLGKLSDAEECFQRAITVTGDMTQKLLMVSLNSILFQLFTFF